MEEKQVVPKAREFEMEAVLKKRKVNEDWAVRNRERKAAKRQRRRDGDKGAVKQAEEFVREFRSKEIDFLRMRTRLKVRKQPPADRLGSKLIFAIRIPGTVDLHPHLRKVLRKLRLTQVLTGVFLRATDLTMKRLLVVEPFVTYGFPNLKNVKELIYKKGRGFLDKEPFPLTSNDLIEKVLDMYTENSPWAFTQNRLLENTASFAWKTLSMKSPRSGHTSEKRQASSCP